jgi:hypothetical protein
MCTGLMAKQVDLCLYHFDSPTMEQAVNHKLEYNSGWIVIQCMHGLTYLDMPLRISIDQQSNGQTLIILGECLQRFHDTHLHKLL